MLRFWNPLFVTGCRGSGGLAPKHVPSNLYGCAAGSSFRQMAMASHLRGESETATIQPALFFFEVHYFDGPPDIYQIPLAISAGAALEEVTANRPDSIVARLTTATGPAVLHDAVARDDFHQGLLRLIAANATLPVSHDGVSASGSGTALEPSLDSRRNRWPIRPAQFRPPWFHLSRSVLNRAKRPRCHVQRLRKRKRPALAACSLASLLLRATRRRRGTGWTRALRRSSRLRWRRSIFPRKLGQPNNRTQRSCSENNFSSNSTGDCSRKKTPTWSSAAFSPKSRTFRGFRPSSARFRSVRAAQEKPRWRCCRVWWTMTEMAGNGFWTGSRAGSPALQGFRRRRIRRRLAGSAAKCRFQIRSSWFRLRSMPRHCSANALLRCISRSQAIEPSGLRSGTPHARGSGARRAAN